MKRQIRLFGIIVLIVSFVCLVSFRENPKPHLIVGLWEITDQNAITLTNSETFIRQLYFGTDELSSSFSFTNSIGKSEEQSLRLAYKTYEEIDDYKKPVLFFVNTCNKDFRLAFTVENLTKDSLEIKCIREITSKDIHLNKEILKFERIGGPPENISHPEGSIHMEIKIDQDKH